MVNLIKQNLSYKPWLPTLVVLLTCLLIVGGVLWQNNNDPMAFVDYDGYFPYHIARFGSDVEKASPFLDRTAYRYQRILYPLTVRFLALGQVEFVPWSLILVNIIAICAGTRFMEILLIEENVSGWYALVYGLYGGQILALLTSLTEPLSYALVLAAILAWKRKHLLWTAVFFALALLTKETAIVFVGGLVLYYLQRREWRSIIIISASLFPYIAYQTFLVQWLGESVMAASEPFNWIPFWGWLIGIKHNYLAFLLVSISIVPMTIIPTVAGLIMSTKSLIKKQRHPYVYFLLTNCLFIAILPFPTFREPSAIIRLTQGLVISMLLYGALIQSKRILNYSVLWIFTSVILLKGSGRGVIPHFD